jgi:hypothetical protein
LPLKGTFSMSRISAHGAVVAATVSAVLGLCLVGGLVGGVATDARAAVDAAAVNGVANADGSTVASQDDALSALLGRPTGGSREGVSFGVGSGVPLQLDLATGLDAGGNALGVSGNAGSGVALSADVAEWIAAASAAPLPVGVPAQAANVLVGGATPAVAAQARSFVLAAASDRPRDIAQRLAAARGWNGAQWSCLSQLWQRESMFETTIRNSRSGAYGIPQALPAAKMATAGADWRVNPVTQIRWGLSYIGTRYGTPCDAWSYWKRHRSY